MQLFEKGCPRLSVFCDRGRLKRLGRETKTKEIYPQFSSHFLSSCQPLGICSGIFQVLNCVPLACSWACIAVRWGGATFYHLCCARTSCCNIWMLKKFVSQKLTQIVIHEGSNGKLQGIKKTTQLWTICNITAQEQLQRTWPLLTTSLNRIITKLTMSLASTLVPTILRRISSSCWMTISYIKKTDKRKRVNH